MLSCKVPMPPDDPPLVDVPVLDELTPLVVPCPVAVDVLIIPVVLLLPKGLPPNAYIPATMRPIATTTPTTPPISDLRDMLICFLAFRWMSLRRGEFIMEHFLVVKKFVVQPIYA